MNFFAATLLLVLFTAVYLFLVFHVVPLYLMVMIARKRAANPGKAYLGARAAVKLLPVVVTSVLILAYAGDSRWLESYLREANEGHEWAILVLLGEVVAVSAYLGGRLTKAEKSLMGKQGPG